MGRPVTEIFKVCQAPMPFSSLVHNKYDDVNAECQKRMNVQIVNS